ncbi:MAG: carbonic anhydrase [Proteobacteria bacterium]|nr:carbonic anhydrase [Pseudomonadota bacterium]
MDKTLYNIAQGYLRFRADFLSESGDFYRRLATNGQKPRVAIISCSDSRVDPAVITDTKPGDMFVLRNVANLIPERTSETAWGVRAALQFAIEVLEVEHFVVCGHSGCGGVQAARRNEMIGPQGQRLDDLSVWLRHLSDKFSPLESQVKELDPELHDEFYEKIGIINSLGNLFTFPEIERRVKDGQLHLHGWYFDIKRGELMAYNSAGYSFVPFDSLIKN